MEEKLTQMDLLGLIKEHIRAAGSQKAFADELGISEQYLSDVLKGRRSPGKKLLKPLGLKIVVYYERIEKRGQEK